MQRICRNCNRKYTASKVRPILLCGVCERAFQLGMQFALQRMREEFALAQDPTVMVDDEAEASA